MRSTTAKLLWTATTLLATLAFGLAAACGDDDDNGSSAGEVEDTVRRTLESSGAEAQFFFAHVTDNFIETALFSARDECEANPDECIGPLTVASVTGTRVNGDRATTTVETDFGTYDLALLREGGVWKLDLFKAASDAVPQGAAMVDLGLTEFAFAFEAADIPAGGNFAFQVKNQGAQVHEVVVVAVPEGVDPEEAVVAVAEEVEPPLAFKIFIQPGQEVDMAFEGPLAPGKYVLVCFFPDTADPEFTSHIDKGMVAEFTVR